MFHALSTAATGLEAQQAKIASIANDLANVNTDSYKRSQTDFEDLVYQTIKEPSEILGASSVSPVGIQIGTGVKVVGNSKIFEQGPTKMTYHPYDLMIQGNGLFQVKTPTGEIAYTRKGSFTANAQGVLTLSNGASLEPPIIVPATAQKILISPSGAVSASMGDATEVSLGQIVLGQFQNERGLLAKGELLYQPTSSSGAVILSLPGENGAGPLQQGALEGSNVNVANSMVDMIATQRAYEMGTKVMSTVDHMLGALGNVK